MKDQTKEWLEFASKDLLCCKKLNDNYELANIIVFHSQQVVEKCFKAILCENDIPIPRIHSISKLYGQIRDFVYFEIDKNLLQKIDVVYTKSRYPGELGLLPDGMPSVKLSHQLFEFASEVFHKTKEMLENNKN